MLAVALSQSGRTEEIVETLAWAKDCGARTMAITNGGGPRRWPRPPIVAFVTQAGIERAVPATKTFTTQLAALAVLGLGLGAPLDPGELRAVPDAIAALLAQPADLEPMVAALAKVPGVVVSGRGMAYAAALELAHQAEGSVLPARDGAVLRRPAARADRRRGCGDPGDRGRG